MGACDAAKTLRLQRAQPDLERCDLRVARHTDMCGLTDIMVDVKSGRADTRTTAAEFACWETRLRLQHSWAVMGGGK